MLMENPLVCLKRAILLSGAELRGGCMRVIYFFILALTACNTTQPYLLADKQADASAKSRPAPETRQPGTSDLINRLRKDPHLSVQQLSDNNTILVQMRSGDSFQSDSAFPTQILMEVLDYVVKVLNDSGDKYEIKVVGHSDRVGSEQANLLVSEKRALSVALYLLNKGVDRKRVSYEGKGSQEPITDNNTQEGRDVNRRVDLLIRLLYNRTAPNWNCSYPDNCS